MKIEEMQKAYDFSVLKDEFKELGLSVSEETLGKLLAINIKWLSRSAVLSSTMLDDMLLGVYPTIQRITQEKIDKIDPND